MKALILCLVVVGLSVWAVLKFGGVSDWDPSAGVADFQAAAVPGEDWQDVVATMRPRAYQLSSPGPFGPEPGAEIRWDPEQFEGKVAAGETAEGFVLLFQPSAGEAWDVHFSGGGKVVAVEEPITGKDLLDGTAAKKMQTF